MALLAFLILVDIKLALIVSSVLITSYVLIFIGLRKYLTTIGKDRLIANKRRYTIISEAFGAIKQVKVSALEQEYIKSFSKTAVVFAKRQASSKVAAELPRFALEAIAFGGMLLVILYLMRASGDFASILPIMALYAYTGYRLLPALQHVYSSTSKLRFSTPALKTLYDDIKSLDIVRSSFSNKNKINLNNKISLKNIVYKYPQASSASLNKISLDIMSKSTVGIVGSTGSGKTTVVDLIMGLLEPESGTLEVDGINISRKNIRNWQRSIGYVPQDIFLADETISNNIAFGSKDQEIDINRVREVAKIANLDEFVMNELPLAYETVVGERGVRLSGGQKQRIGIARALYHNPDILILDEATSALDNLTEKAVMNAVNKLNKKITIIMIAHRLSTVQKCDNIILLEKGMVIAEGAYDRLIEKNSEFKKMVEV